MKTGKDSASPLSTRLRRFLQSEFARTGHQLRVAAAEEGDSPVHEARKSIKKLRAGLRLAVHMFPKSSLRKMEFPLRAAAHWLGPLRDHEVLEATLRKLLRRGEQRPEKRVPPAARLPVLKARAALKQAGQALRRLDWDEADRDAWRKGLRRLYRRGRKAMQQAETGGSDDDFHLWRRRAKDLLYALQLLNRREFQGGAHLVKKVKRLTDHLGDDHDLAFLGTAFSGATEQKKLPDILQRAQTNRHKLQQKARALGEQIFSGRAREFAKRLKGG